MGLIDSHAHLTSKALADRTPELLTRCQESGVDHVISIATDVVDSHRTMELARRHDEVSATAGIHPHEAGHSSEDDCSALQEIWSSGQVCAAGEMGLDFHYDFAPRDQQIKVFKRQLVSARSFDLPLVIHCREAHRDVVKLLLEHGYSGRRVVFHCFTGTSNEADELMDHGWRISFTGIVTFSQSTELQAIAKGYPPDQLMVETDSPYLSPEPVRKVRPNEPSHVAYVARFLADLRGEPFEELAARTTANTRLFFGI